MADIGDTRKKEIEEKVYHILKSKKISFKKSPSVDIVSLVKKEGFVVKPQIMPIETTGCIFVNEMSKKPEKIITVNKIFKNPHNEVDVVLKKSRFITAHEYGHFILHKPTDQPLYAHRDSDKRDEPIELEADYFARSILMPCETFLICYQIFDSLNNGDGGQFKVDCLSKLFKVTRGKIQKRISDINLLNTLKK